DLHVEDALFPENEGGLRLAVDEGRGAVEASSRATARLDVSTLAALFTGWLPAREAVRLGRLTGATPTEVSRLELIFAGPRPWLMAPFCSREVGTAVRSPRHEQRVHERPLHPPRGIEQQPSAQ